MKKFFTFILATLLSVNVFAQCPLSTAVDFTATDCHGTEVHLFDILDGGQYVLIDFFYTTCSPCNTACPKVVEAYQLLGCNMHDVFFMEISPSDNDTQCQNWCNQYGVEYPTIGTSSGGGSICNTYGIPAYPTVILIKPDRSIVINDLWPISNAQTITSALAPYGIEEHDCTSPASASVEISDITTTNTTVTATFTPNEDCASYYYMIGTEAEMAMWVQMMQTPLEQLVMQWGIQTTGVDTYTWTDQAPGTEYTIYVVPVNADETLGEMVTATATTTAAGGPGVSEIEMTVEVLSPTEVKTFTTPNDQTAEYHYGLIEKAYYEEIGEEGLIQIIQEDIYPYYEYSEWIWLELSPETEYYGFARGFNANGEWGTITLVPFTTMPNAIEDVNALSFNIFPNPADNFVKIEGNNIQTVEIFNMTGQAVVRQDVSGNETTISTENLESGVYFVKVNGTMTQKLVVK
ncbi:MAG: T9SS type A sorting domain-containing protein [Bacteroidales bacterium]|nr:T9SS type A sorting domain-containing protein [Bacteroidales bacterium]